MVRLELAHDDGHDRVEARRLLDYRIQVIEATTLLCSRRGQVRSVPDDRCDLRAGSRQDVRVLQQAVNHPRHQRGRRLMAGHQHGEHLIPDFLVAHGQAILVTRGDQHAHDVGSFLGPRRPTAPNLVVQQLVDLAANTAKAPPSLDRTQRVSHVEKAERFDNGCAQANQARFIGHTEYDPQHDFQGDVLQACVNRKRRIDRPGIDRSIGNLAHHLAVQPHALAVKRRHEQPALAPVSGTIKQQQGVGSEEDLEDGVGLAAPKLVRVAGKDLPDGSRIGEEDHRREAELPHGECVAIPIRAGLHERERRENPLDQLKKGRDAWPVRQLRHRQPHGSLHPEPNPRLRTYCLRRPARSHGSPGVSTTSSRNAHSAPLAACRRFALPAIRFGGEAALHRQLSRTEPQRVFLRQLWVRIPEQSDHSFHGKVITDSIAK